MFNKRYGLEQAVLDRIKTMTRRFLNKEPSILRHFNPELFEGGKDPYAWVKDERGLCRVLDDNYEIILPHYKIGDVLAIAQSYKDVGINPHTIVGMKDEGQNMYTPIPAIDSSGWKNKMFVREEFMPVHIETTGLKLQRLQDISEDDCLKEGVEKWIDCYIVSGIMENQGRNNVCFDTPREAFSALIDRISGKGTWQRNPWTVAYEFELQD